MIKAIPELSTRPALLLFFSLLFAASLLFTVSRFCYFGL